MSAAQPAGNLAQTSVADLVARLAARTPAPGGGAAAAIAGALGCATGAMAARYTTGAKWADRSDKAEALAAELDAAAARLLALADADAAAFAAVGAARKSGDAMALKVAEARSIEIPVSVMRECALQAGALATFRSACNPQLVSDIAVGIHLLAGAGRSAWSTLCANPLSDGQRALAAALLAAYAAAEAQP
jgi:formiminotetrahydrofolate cyclodeaminase